MVRLSKESVCEWQQEQEFKAEIEAQVMRNCIWGVEEKLCDIKDGRMKEISSLRQELDIISKSLSVSDVGQLSSHGSLEGDEEINGLKKGDCSHSKVLNKLKSSSSSPPSSSLSTTSTSSMSTSTSSSSLLEENGKHAESRLMRMSKKDLINHYNNEMTKLKINHESQLGDMTEQQFSLKRELLKEIGGFSLPTKKSKEFDMLRKRIAEVISKLDELLVKKEQIATFGVHEQSLACLKDRVESLVSENHQLRDLLTDKKREVEFLSLQVSEAADKISDHSLVEVELLKTTANLISAIEEAQDRVESLVSENHQLRDLLTGKKREVEYLSLQVSEAADKISDHSLAEAELLKTTANLKSAIEDAHIEAAIHEDAFACILREMMMDQIKCLAEESEVEYNFMQEIYESEIGDLNMEFIVMQEVYAVLFREALKDAKQKEQLSQDAAVALEQEKKRYELAAQEVENLRGETCQQQQLISESSEKSNATHRTLVEALKKIERHKAHISKLDQKLAQTMKELREVNEERRILLDVNQEKQNAVSLFEANERELKEQLGSTAVYILGLLKSVNDFERRVTQDISRKSSRLKSLSSQSRVLKEKANVLVRRELVCKQKLERKCSDLEKAEAEVDLLGDEVDTLLSLAEKLYTALDHYSPILQHYPGVTEILKLLKRELLTRRNKAV